MNASDLHTPRQESRDITSFDVWLLSRILIGSSAVLTLATFNLILG